MTDSDNRWTRKAMLEAIRSGSLEERLMRLRKIGLIDEHNQLTERYTNWGERASRTPDEAPSDEAPRHDI